MLRIVASGYLLVEGQPGLGLVKLFLADDGRHRNGNPFFGGRWLLTDPRSDRQQGRLALSGCHRMCPLGIGRAGVGWILQDTPDTGYIPALTAAGCGDAVVRKTFGNGVQAHLLFQIGIPGEDLPDDSGFHFIHPYPARVTGTFHIQDVAIGWLGPGQELPGTQFHQPSTAHTLGDQSPLVFGHSTSDLQDQLVMGIIAHRTIQELNTTAMALQFFQDQSLMDVLAGQTVWRSDQYQFKLGHGCPITQAVQTGTVQLGPAVAIIPKDVLLGQTPPLSGNVGSQTFQLLFYGLRLLLTLGRDTNIDGDIHLLLPPFGLSAASCHRAGLLLYQPTA